VSRPVAEDRSWSGKREGPSYLLGEKGGRRSLARMEKGETVRRVIVKEKKPRLLVGLWKKSRRKVHQPIRKGRNNGSTPESQHVVFRGKKFPRSEAASARKPEGFILR